MATQKTSWHSAKENRERTKTITVDFQVSNHEAISYRLYIGWPTNFVAELNFKEPIYFNRLTMQKRYQSACGDHREHDCNERYFNICLVLDSATDDALCTG